MSGIFNPAIFNNSAFNIGDGGITQVVIKTGTGGIDPVRKKKRKTLSIYKPTGLVYEKEARKDVEDRIDESREIQAEIASRLSREFTEESRELGEIREIAFSGKKIAEMTAAEVDKEIGILLRQKMRTEEEELMLLLMIAANE